MRLSSEHSDDIECDDTPSPSERADSLEPLASDLPDFIIVDRGEDDIDELPPATRTGSAPSCLRSFQLDSVDKQAEAARVESSMELGRGEEGEGEILAPEAGSERKSPHCKQGEHRRIKPFACKYHNRSPISFRSQKAPSPSTPLVQVKSLTAEMRRGSGYHVEM
mmetsp:Transcript_32896/g.104026  ORF Transcript_32896/g.104026 Transcript_32896/m.104026 type:complete len:165 (-) Transcript_32896:1099-1593(-)